MSGHLRCKRDGLAAAFQCLLIAVCVIIGGDVDSAKRKPIGRIIRIKVNCLLIAFDGLVIIAQIPVCIAKVISCHCIARINVKSFTAAFDSLLVVALAAVTGAKINP